jgi:hypothetical protein
VLRGRFRRDTDDPDAPDVTPYISRRSAQEIVKGSFAPQDLTMEGTIHGIMPLAFAPRSGAEQYDAFQDDDDEDKATYISTEAVQARRLKASAKAKAPKDYTNMMDALRAASMVWTVLFRRDCPLVISLNVLRSALASHKEHLKDAMSSTNVANLVWGLSMVAHTYFLAPYGSQGEVPSPKMEYLIVNARGCTFPSPVNLPMGFSGGTDAPPPRPLVYDRVDTTFGERANQRPQSIALFNPNVNPSIKALCDQIRQYDPNITISGLLRSTPITPGQVNLVDGNCVDFLSLGVCRRGVQCRFQHDPTARPSPERVENFLNLVKPVVDGLNARRPAKRGRRGA